jgi:hypothetical protein
MMEILQHTLPTEMQSETRLPGMAPVEPDGWLRVDEAYGEQMQRRLELFDRQIEDVIWMDPSALGAAQEVLDAVLEILPRLGFSSEHEHEHEQVTCPDGRVVQVMRDAPLLTLGQLVQEDICLMRKEGVEHVLVGAVLCFPASWRLAEKAGKPLIGIHEPVSEYDDHLAKRVQRLFDGVRTGRPLWRYNRLWYDDPELHQPRSAREPRRISPDQQAAPYIRSERQCVVQMPKTDIVVFSIHTYVVRT